MGIEEAVRSPLFSHARTKRWCGVEVTYLYHRDPESPSGVRLAACGRADEVDPVLRAFRSTSPLSPTEAR